MLAGCWRDAGGMLAGVLAGGRGEYREARTVASGRLGEHRDAAVSPRNADHRSAVRRPDTAPLRRRSHRRWPVRAGGADRPRATLRWYPGPRRRTSACRRSPDRPAASSPTSRTSHVWSSSTCTTVGTMQWGLSGNSSAKLLTRRAADPAHSGPGRGVDHARAGRSPRPASHRNRSTLRSHGSRRFARPWRYMISGPAPAPASTKTPLPFRMKDERLTGFPVLRIPDGLRDRDLELAGERGGHGHFLPRSDRLRISYQCAKRPRTLEQCAFAEKPWKGATVAAASSCHADHGSTQNELRKSWECRQRTHATRTWCGSSSAEIQVVRTYMFII